MKTVRQRLYDQSHSLHISTFDDRPGKLFEGLQHCRSTIFLSDASRNSSSELLTTRYQRWATNVRHTLFERFEYAHASTRSLFPDLYPKYATEIEVSAFKKIIANSSTNLGHIRSDNETQNFIFYQEATQYWIKATIDLPYYSKDGVVGAPPHGRYLYFKDKQITSAAYALLNSGLFYLYFIAFGDCFHLSDKLVNHFPLPPDLVKNKELGRIGKNLQNSLIENSHKKTIRTRDGSEITYAEFFVSKSKDIVNRIDAILADYYGFTDKELELIMNYDVKYRMGIEQEEDG